MTAPDQPIHAYLAGPDVFAPDALEIGAAKKAILREYGIIGHFPLDIESPSFPGDDGRAMALRIARICEEMMREIAAPQHIPVILADMTPYHGPSMDVGTAFEMGFMSALADSRPDLVIIGYTDDPRIFEARVIAEIHNGQSEERGGLLWAPDGRMIEAFGQADNAMLVHAIAKTGGRICASFEEAAALAAALAARRI